MTLIYDDAVENLAPLAQIYGNIMKEISDTAQELRERFLKDGTIVTVPVLDENEAGTVSLCSIDGASGSEKLQSADILIAGSTLHDGVLSKELFDKDSQQTKPSFTYSDVRIHSSKNEQILSALRAFTEIAVLGEAEHNIVIIDGAYLGNFLTVLFQLQDSEYTAAKIIEHMKKDTNKSFLKGVNKILNVSYQLESNQDIIALAKSDSSREMVKRYVGNKSDFFATDKMLAEYMLKPGEMLLPASVNANKGRISLLERDDHGSWQGFKWNPKKVLSSEDFHVVEEFFDGVNSISDNDLFSLYTYLYDFDTYAYTYFKPHKFREGSNPLRIEFVTNPISSNTSKAFSRRNDKAIYLASHVNADIINPTFKEPYSQYMVDKDVKSPVSRSLAYFRMRLGKEISHMGIHIDGVTSSYRT